MQGHVLNERQNLQKGKYKLIWHIEQNYGQKQKKKCRLGEEEIRMAKEMGLNPKSLIKKTSQAQKQQWKAPVKVWICEMYAERQRKAENKKEDKSS